MKRLLLLLLCLFTMGTAWSRDTLRLDLSQPTIPDVLEFDPATGHWVDTYDEFAALQFNGMFNMSRMSDSYGNFYWHGFSVGTNGDITNYGVAGSSDGWVANQWGCMAGGGIKTNAHGWVVKDAQGHIESELGKPYLIGTGNPWMGGPDRIIAIDLADGVARQALGIYVCNHPWPYYGNINGDGFARPLDQPGDYFHLVAHGEQADGTETTVTYVLAEYRDGELHQSDRWNYFDLRSLGEVVSIWFTFETTDVGAYGPNTAAYVCLDRLELLEPQVATPVQVTVVMNPVSNLMKLHNKATSAEVNVGSPMGPPQGNAPKTYRFNTLPGTYTLTGYAPDGTTVIGSIDIEITEEASQTISIYAATASATNSGWALGTDYSVVLKSLSGSNGSVRTFTTGNDNTGKLSFLLLNGDTYVIDLVPSAARQADGYMTKTLTGTLNGNGTITGEITMGGNYNITVPEGVSVFVGTKSKHYVPFAEVQPESVSTSGGKTVYAYSLANNTQYNYRVSQPGKLTHGGIFYMNSDATKRPTLVFTEADMNRAAPTFVDREVSGSKVADIFLNINERHHLRMNVGGEHKMLAQRNWQLVANPIDNYFIEPDYRYTVLNINGQPDQSVVRVENIKGINTVKAVGNGTAIVLVSYDAIYLEQYQRNSALPTAFVAGSLNGAIWPENTGVFVVTVGDQPSGITSNMLINEGRNTTQHKLAGDAVDAEHDVFYYLAPDQGYSYTFKPTGVASVAIAKPTLGANMATYDGFETVQPNADGSYTVLLTHGRSIVRLTNAQGVSDYQVLTAKQAEFTITNLTNNGKPVIPGDQVEILLGGLYHPANKQAGTYNMSAQVEYTSPAGNHTANGGQYSFASTAKKFKLTIPADWDVDASNSFIITDGTIKSGGFGDPYGNHRNVSPSEGRAPNFTANLHPAWFGALPDIRVKVQKTAECQDVMDSYTVNACGSYEWEGNTYTESGIYTINGQTHCGADHVKTLHLTINQPVTHEFSEVACGSYTWNGQEYTTSGDHVQTFTAANGCDSIVTLHLTVMPLVLTDPTVYFVHADGRKQLLDANNTIELTVLNQGRFYFEGEGCTVLDKWEGREETLQGGWHYWLDQWSDDFTNCRYNPRTTTDGRQITITYIQNGATQTLSFTLKVVASAIEEIKAYVGTTELSMDNPYTVQGNERTYITVKGRYANATDWVELPESAYRIADSDKVHVLDNSFSLWMTGEYVLTVEMKDSDLKLDFKVISAFVPLTDFTVLAPATWTIVKWNTLNDKYMGISEVDMADKDHGYVLTFAPENASNTELEWESLTPDVAVFDPLHSNGIVPNKAGEARFRVRSVSNPEVEREVVVNFVYKHPLLSVSGPSELHLNAGDEFDLGAELTFNPSNATEQRLEFTYSASGIVDAVCAVEVAGGVGQHTTKHTLTALANGVATLTCTPFDQSAGAEAFDIIVRVGSYTLNYTATNGGSISGAATQNVPHGLSGVEVAAVPEVGFKFLRWSDGRTDNPRIDVNVEENVSVTAEFVPENTTIYTLLYTATGGGSISGAAQQSVVEGQNGIAVTAVPNKGYRFVQWSDGRTEATRMEENVTSDMTIEAEFIKQIRVDYLAAANGRIDGPAAQIVDRGVATEAVTATADEGYRFVRWSDGRTEATRADIIDANIDDTTFVAQFELIRYELTISVLGDDDQPIAGAKVTLGGKDYTTDAKGVVVDTLLPETYAYTVECEGYNAKSGEVVLNSDTLVKVTLSKPSAPATGLFDNVIESLSVYPNPTMGELWLTVPEPVEGTVEGAAAEVLVYSINGQLMLRVPMRASAGSAPAVAGSAPAAGRIRIDLSGLPAGVYIIRVGNAVAKVVRL